MRAISLFMDRFRSILQQINLIDEFCLLSPISYLMSFRSVGGRQILAHFKL